MRERTVDIRNFKFPRMKYGSIRALNNELTDPLQFAREKNHCERIVILG